MIDGMLQYYMGIPNPEALDDYTWARKYEILKLIRKQEKIASQEEQLGRLFK